MGAKAEEPTADRNQGRWEQKRRVAIGVGAKAGAIRVGAKTEDI